MKLPAQLIDNTLQVASMSWHARNEITHDKPLRKVEGLKRFLYGYAKLLGSIKEYSTEQVFKEKQLMVESCLVSGIVIKKDMSDKPWAKPPEGWVKLSVDGSFEEEDGSA
jgi:hypothetical protein